MLLLLKRWIQTPFFFFFTTQQGTHLFLMTTEIACWFERLFVHGHVILESLDGSNTHTPHVNEISTKVTMPRIGVKTGKNNAEVKEISNSSKNCTKINSAYPSLGPVMPAG